MDQKPASMKNPFLSFRKGDLMAIVLVILLAAGTFTAFLPGKSDAESASVQIFRDNILIHELPLNADAEFEISGDYTNAVRIQDGRVCISSSDCPGGDCVHSGWISHRGRSIVCLPNRVEIRVTGRSDVDFVLR